MLFWQCYFEKYGLAVNGLEFKWDTKSDTEKMAQIITMMGGTIDAELIEKYRSIEREQKADQ